MSSTPNLTNLPFEAGVIITNALGVAVQTVYTGPSVGGNYAGGAKITKMTAVSNDTSQVIYVQIYKIVGGIQIAVGDPVAVPMATAKGSFNSATADLLAALYASGVSAGAMNIGAGTVLQAQLSVAPASGKTVTVSVEGAAF